jgi:hypothetical protein
VITTSFRDTWDGAGVLNQADHRATGWTVLDAVRDAGNRWVFPELLAEGLEPWDGVTQVWAAGSPDARHGVDITASFAQGVASLRAHEAYLRGLRSGTFDPEAYLAGLDRTDGVRRASGTATDMPMGQPVRCHAPHCPPQWVVRRSRSATLLHLAIDGSGFPAANDEPEDPEVKLVSRFGLLEVLPPAREFIGREDSGLLRSARCPSKRRCAKAQYGRTACGTQVTSVNPAAWNRRGRLRPIQPCLMPSLNACTILRVVPLYGLSTNTASQSKSNTTTFPPGRVTRTISASAF